MAATVAPHVLELGDAAYVYVAYTARGRKTHDEVLCRACYDAMAARDAFAGSSLARGQSVTIRPWHGDPDCSGCQSTDAGLGSAQVQP